MAETLQQFGEMTACVFEAPGGKSHIEVAFNASKGKELKTLSMIAAFLTSVIGQKSNLGYEKTLESVTEQAMTYKFIGCNQG